MRAANNCTTNTTVPNTSSGYLFPVLRPTAHWMRTANNCTTHTTVPITSSDRLFPVLRPNGTLDAHSKQLHDKHDGSGIPAGTIFSSVEKTLHGTASFPIALCQRVTVRPAAPPCRTIPQPAPCGCPQYRNETRGAAILPYPSSQSAALFARPLLILFQPVVQHGLVEVDVAATGTGDKRCGCLVLSLCILDIGFRRHPVLVAFGSLPQQQVR